METSRDRKNKVFYYGAVNYGHSCRRRPLRVLNPLNKNITAASATVSICHRDRKGEQPYKNSYRRRDAYVIHFNFQTYRWNDDNDDLSMNSRKIDVRRRV